MSVGGFLDTLKAVCLCTLAVATTAVMFKFYNILKGVDSVVSEVSTNVVPGVNSILSTSNNLLTAVSNNLNTATATLSSNDIAMAISNAAVTFVNNLNMSPQTCEQIQSMVDFFVKRKQESIASKSKNLKKSKGESSSLPPRTMNK